MESIPKSRRAFRQRSQKAQRPTPARIQNLSPIRRWLWERDSKPVGDGRARATGNNFHRHYRYERKRIRYRFVIVKRCVSNGTAATSSRRAGR